MKAWLSGLMFLVFCGVAAGQEIRRAVPVQPDPEEPTARPAGIVPAEVAVAEPDVAGAENDLANFLAGLRVSPGSPLASLQMSGDYGDHSVAMAQLWRRYNENYFLPMRLWSEISLAPRLTPDLPLMYFFGGPDALNAIALFPEASAYLLGGLEPVGTVVPPHSLAPEELAAALANLRQSVEVVLSYGHFITKDMREDLERSAFRGSLPLILAFVALSGGEVFSVTYIGIGPGGTLTEFGNQYRGGKGHLPGVKVVFRRSPTSPPQSIFYVQANVADGPLKANSAVLQWTQSFGVSNAYLKAASYLMHEAGFSRIRGFILDRSQAILQDDSGIPLRFFRQGHWRLEFFGTYTGTLDIFRKYYQADLQDQFATQPVPELPFGTGYKWRKGESNLMLALRMREIATPQAP